MKFNGILDNYIYRDGNGQQKNIKGDTLVSPKSKSILDDSTVVYNSGGNICNIPSIDLTPDNNPLFIMHNLLIKIVSCLKY